MRVSKTTTSVLLCSLSIAVFIVSGTLAQESEPAAHKQCEDDYSTSDVESAVRFAEQGIYPGIYDALEPRWGDNVSIALLKAYTEDELLVPKRLKSVLLIVREAFSAPCDITLPIDKTPRLSVFLLEDLARQTKDYRSKVQILDTMAYVKQQTAAIHCEEPETSGKFQQRAPVVASRKPKP